MVPDLRLVFVVARLCYLAHQTLFVTTLLVFFFIKPVPWSQINDCEHQKSVQ